MERSGSKMIVVALALGSTMAIACSPKASGGPGLAAAESQTAQKELRQLEDDWEVRRGPARAELRAPLETYVEKYRDDPSVARARLMLAQIALFERRLGSAEEILRPVLTGPAGRTKDEANVVLAAIENRRGHHEAALERLEPLAGKLLTRDARDQYARERLSAAIAARRWRLTVDAMTAWLAEPGADSRSVKDWIEAAIVQVPARALSRLLKDWETDSPDPAKQAAGRWVKRLVIEHLADEALRSRDPHLARDLLERSPPWLRAGEKGDDLAVLAALAQKDARVVGRGVGVVLGGEGAEERRRSVRVALGLIRGLRLGRGEGAPNGIQILAVEDRGSMSSALGTLTGLGASILVAGVDDQGAQEAMVFAEARQVPVIVMARPLAPVSTQYGFVFGESLDAQKSTVDESFAVVGRGGVACQSHQARPTTTTLPLAEWREEGKGSVLVLGDGHCCRQVADQVDRSGWRAGVVCGLEGAHWAAATGGLKWIGSGAFPAVPRRAGDQISENERRWEEGASAPRPDSADWFYSLGFDAAQLVQQALSALPEGQVTEKAAVQQRHRLARSELGKARAPLRTTDAQGFGSDRVIPRSLQVRSSEDDD